MWNEKSVSRGFVGEYVKNIKNIKKQYITVDNSFKLLYTVSNEGGME